MLTHIKTYKIFLHILLVGHILIFSTKFCFAGINPDITNDRDDIYTDSLDTKKSKPANRNEPFKETLTQKNQRKPILSRFKNEYLLIRDIRRLFQFVDRTSIDGYESLSELVNISKNFTKQQQTKIIGAAAAGGIAGMLSDMTNKMLRKHKINFVQWKLDRIFFRQTIFYSSFFYSSSFSEQIYGIYFTKFRLYYTHHITDYAVSDNFTIWFNSVFGFSYTRYNERTMLSPIFAFPIGTFALSYDQEYQTVISRIDVMKMRGLLFRLVHVNYLHRDNADYWRNEVLILW